MIRTLTAALVLTSCAPVFAEQPENLGAWCRAVHDASIYIMGERQQHKSMPDMIKEAASVDSERASVYFVSIVVQAYDHPAWSHPESQNRSIKRFANEQYMKCIKEGWDV